MRIRYGLWVVFGLMLAMVMGSAARACDGCAGDGGAVTPGKGTTVTEGDPKAVAPERERSSEARTSGRRGGSVGEVVVYGYPIVDEPEPVVEPEDPELEPWDEEAEHPFGDDDDMDMGPMRAPESCDCPGPPDHTCNSYACGTTVPSLVE